jgi:CDP-4-dehydro-6-deoxyglucose reductase/ferredoxin-NAD(P)+ reductase (naphthalene dioxygenase ferredoxin-specific)
MPIITIEQLGIPLKSRKGTILDAALAAGIAYPHSCRVGECGSCKSRLVAGEVFSPVPVDPSALTPTERAAGVILPCRSWPKTDVTVAWLAEVDASETAPIRQTTARVVGIEESTHDIKRLRLEVDGSPLIFAAGQYVQLQFGRQPARSFSMANRPDEDTLEFHIRRTANGGASAYVAEQLRMGERVRLRGPFGSATLRKNHDGPMIAAAGGSGLAPIRSIVRTALAGRSTQPIHLYFGAREERDIYYETELLQLAADHPNLRVEVVLSGAERPIDRRTGFVHEAIGNDLSSLADTKLYVAGPPPMVTAVTELARSRGARESDIHADAFTSSAPPSRRGGLVAGLRALLGSR